MSSFKSLQGLDSSWGMWVGHRAPNHREKNKTNLNLKILCIYENYLMIVLKSNAFKTTALGSTTGSKFHSKVEQSFILYYSM